MSRRPSGPDFVVPDGFADDVMRRVAAAPAPMPARSVLAAVSDRSAVDLFGSIAAASRLVQRRGHVPLMIRAQALAVVVLVAVSVGGSGALAAAAAYRTVAPIVFPSSAPSSISEPVLDEPDTIPPPSPLVVSEPDRPDAPAVRPGAAEPAPTMTRAPGAPQEHPRDPTHHAVEDHAKAHGDAHDGGGSEASDDPRHDGDGGGDHGGGDEGGGDAGSGDSGSGDSGGGADGGGADGGGDHGGDGGADGGGETGGDPGGTDGG